MPTRLHAFPERIHQPLSLFQTDSPLKAHPAYLDAKAGGVEAATRLILDLALPFLIETAGNFHFPACFVAPHALEATGDNAIPQALATACALAAEGTLDVDIVQTTRIFHTDADPMERLASRPDFEGIVIPESDYVLVDDVTTMGGTLADLSDYVQSHGGRVAGVIVLVNAGRASELRPSKTTISKLTSRHGEEIQRIFGIHPAALTANEANYLIGFRTADEIRNRLAAAREETDRRLRSKGIER